MNDAVKQCLKDADSYLHAAYMQDANEHLISAIRCLLQAIEHLAEPANPEKKAANYWCAKGRDGQIIGEGQKPTEAEALCWVSSWMKHGLWLKYGLSAAVGRTSQEARDLCDMAKPAKPEPQPTPRAGKPWTADGLCDLIGSLDSHWLFPRIAVALNKLGVLDPRE